MQTIYLSTPGLVRHPTHIPQHGSPHGNSAMCVCDLTCAVCSVRLYALVCCWGGMKRIEANIKGCSQMGGKKRGEGEGGREGTLSRNAPVLVQPATSYHETSTDRWIHESPIIEILMHKQLKWRGWEWAGGCCFMSADADNHVCCCCCCQRSAVGPASSWDSF